MSGIDSIKEKLAPLFEGKPVYCAIVFGSYAKGLADEKSDVDIVIDFKGRLVALDFFRILDLIVDALGRDVGLIEISDIRPGSPIYNTNSCMSCFLFRLHW